MAKRVITILIDDTDKGLANEIVAFALGGIDYKIDLSVTHVNELREDSHRWARTGRRVQRRRCRGTDAQIDYTARGCNCKVRKWTLERGIDASDRGRVPSSIMKQCKREDDG